MTKNMLVYENRHIETWVIWWTDLLLRTVLSFSVIFFSFQPLLLVYVHETFLILLVRGSTLDVKTVPALKGFNIATPQTGYSVITYKYTKEDNYHISGKKHEIMGC